MPDISEKHAEACNLLIVAFGLTVGAVQWSDEARKDFISRTLRVVGPDRLREVFPDAFPNMRVGKDGTPTRVMPAAPGKM